MDSERKQGAEEEKPANHVAGCVEHDITTKQQGQNFEGKST